jgi:hypothetical protein
MSDHDLSDKRLTRLDDRITEVTRRRALKHQTADDLRLRLLAELDQMMSELRGPETFVAR